MKRILLFPIENRSSERVLVSRGNSEIQKCRSYPADSIQNATLCNRAQLRHHPADVCFLASQAAPVLCSSCMEEGRKVRDATKPKPWIIVVLEL